MTPGLSLKEIVKILYGYEKEEEVKIVEENYPKQN